MAKINWKIEDLLSVGENLIYKCTLEDEKYDEVIEMFLTNYRIIKITDDRCICNLLKSIDNYGMLVGYEDYSEERDWGTGEYGIYFYSAKDDVTMWFYSKDACKTFYDELTRAILELE